MAVNYIYTNPYLTNTGTTSSATAITKGVPITTDFVQTQLEHLQFQISDLKKQQELLEGIMTAALVDVLKETIEELVREAKKGTL
jgi:N-acyl-L-homoserine lactone synthetase